MPAFKMEVFEEARSVVASAPRVTSTILTGKGATEPEHRRNTRRNVNKYIASIEDWRSRAIRLVMLARAELKNNYSYLTVSHMEKLAADIDEFAAEIDSTHANLQVSDGAMLERLRVSTEEVSKYSADTGKFLKREEKRLAEAFILRKDTLMRNRARILEAKKFLEALIERESVPAPNFASDEERDAYVGQALNRPPDIKGTKARTLELLARFPKTAAYLAR